MEIVKTPARGTKAGVALATETVKKIKAVLAGSGLTAKEFAATLGFSEAYLSNILRGYRKPSREVIERLSEVYGLSLGDISGPGASADTAYVELIRQEAAAGIGAEIEDYAEKTHIAVPRSLIAPHRPDYIKAVIVRGESMVDEKIYDGDYVLYNQHEREGEHIFVVSVDNTLLVKRVIVDSLKAEIRLVSANRAAADAYRDRIFIGSECESVRIAGKVIASLHRIAP
jgi:SOS-response transcriptional repressor LexA